MFYPAEKLVLGTLTDASRAHFQHLVNQVGPITEAEVEAKIPEAARIHARAWDTSSDPLDFMVPIEAHDWAIRHIAANLVARERGYDAAWTASRRVAPQREVELVPARRTEDWS